MASTRRWAALAAVPMHLALSATPLPKISSTCWNRKASYGIDLDSLLAARETLSAGLPNEQLHGRVAKAGVPRTYRRAKAPSPETN